MSKTMQYVYKGGIAVAALLASLMLLLPYIVASAELLGAKVSEGTNIFDAWEVGLDGAETSMIMAVICYSVVFFLGLILAVLAVLSIFVDNKIISMIFKVVAIVLAVLAIVGLVCNFVYLGSDDVELAKQFGTTVSIGAAGIVSAIFSVATAGLIWAEKSLVK